MKCHNCTNTMELTRTASGERSKTQWHRCPVCHAEHMSTRLVLDEDQRVTDMDPFSNFIVSSSQSINANDENDFQLRQMDYH
jgi:hypothetical protein